MAWPSGPAAAGFPSLCERRISDAAVSAGTGFVSGSALPALDGVLWQFRETPTLFRRLATATVAQRSF